MKKIKVELENCYGIRKFSHSFDFTRSKSFAIYAPNGSMKTSFANTLDDFSNGVESCDRIFRERKTKREILEIENQTALEPDQVFVVKPYDASYESKKTSTLLVNQTLKKSYEGIWASIEEKQGILVDSLKKVSGLRSGIEDTISRVVMSIDGEFLAALLRLRPEVMDGLDPVFAGIEYKTIFNDKVLNFLSSGDIAGELSDYVERYDELLEKSKYFRKGVFNHTNASTIAKTLVANGFFEASHTVSFADEASNKSEITSKEQLEGVIRGELEGILQDKVLLDRFKKIDDKLKNQELQKLRDYLSKHKELISELTNIQRFHNKVWVDFLKSCKDAFSALVDRYDEAKSELEQIRKQALEERTRWNEIVDTFNKRFSVPFVLTVENKEDVILKNVLPVVGFEFYDKTDHKVVDQVDLLKVLSTGERKALYILNVLFEIEARKEDSKDTLLIIDDVADSFDYRNKYAIIEYLSDNADAGNLYQIILSHNFDFFRTLENRFVNRPCCLMVEKCNSDTKLIDAAYIRDPFKNFLENTDDVTKFLALIPFMRNLVEYLFGVGDEKYITLTSILHQKDRTPLIKKSDIYDIMDGLFAGRDIPRISEDLIVSDLLVKQCDDLVGRTESQMLETKIVLSIGIRLRAERFMIGRLKQKPNLASIDSKQTITLFKQYRDDWGETEDLQVLKRVNLITPQNIHINSFMYEPILDMSDVELKELYGEIKALDQ